MPDSLKDLRERVAGFYIYLNDWLAAHPAPVAWPPVSLIVEVTDSTDVDALREQVIDALAGLPVTVDGVPVPQPVTVQVTAPYGLSLRSAPVVGVSTYLETLPYGARATQRGEVQGEDAEGRGTRWLEVETRGGRVGFVYSYHVREV